jgi:hypothetical protein
MKRSLVAAFVVGLWLYGWASNTAVLVWSSGNHGVRSCYYLIGVSILWEKRGEYSPARRCPLLARVY